MNQTPSIFPNLLRDHVCMKDISAMGNQFLMLDFIRKVLNKESFPLRSKDIQIKADAHILSNVCVQRCWNSLDVSKRLEIVQSRQNKTYTLLGIVCNSIESGGFLSLENAINPRAFRAWTQEDVRY